MVLLDLSASFDTIDQEILLERLRYRYGFSNLVLQWFTSYLVERPQHSVRQAFFPASSFIMWTQGSVLGPVLFSLHISLLAHGLNAKIYADDSQLYIIVRQNNRTSATALQDLALRIQDIMSRNVGNMLIDNPKKTEIIHLTFYTAPEPVPAIKTGDCSITPSSEVKGLGVPLDRLFTFKTHIDNICQSTSRSIHHIGKIRNFLSGSPTERLIRVFFFVQNLIPATAFFTACPPTS